MTAGQTGEFLEGALQLLNGQLKITAKAYVGLLVHPLPVVVVTHPQPETQAVCGVGAAACLSRCA